MLDTYINEVISTLLHIGTGVYPNNDGRTIVLTKLTPLL